MTSLVHGPCKTPLVKGSLWPDQHIPLVAVLTLRPKCALKFHSRTLLSDFLSPPLGLSDPGIIVDSEALIG